MWNTANIDSEWYMLDATWDDVGVDGLHYYNYFNLTTGEMRANHVIDESEVRVPACTATKHASYHDFVLEVQSLSAAPVNYKSVIDGVAKSKDKYLCVYVGEVNGDVQKYISDYIFSSKSDVQKYIKQKGYKISLDGQYYISGNYCYIQIK